MTKKETVKEMKPQTLAFLIRLSALITLFSGIVNLFSVVRPKLLDREEILLRIFPMEFLHLSHFLTLFIGFGLVVSSINIYKRKTLAFRIVLALAILSIIFHLTKALDYEEALISLLLLIILYISRAGFTVKSQMPEPGIVLARLGAGITFALAYGIAGFWFLDPKEFGINFNLPDSIHHTFQLLTFQSALPLMSRTPHAHLFLDSFYFISMIAIMYSFIVLYRPVIYRYYTHPHEREQARNIIRKYGRSTLDYFKFWPDKTFFFSKSRGSVISYRVSGNSALTLGDPVGPEEELEGIIHDFSNYCRQNDWGCGFYQTIPDFLSLYEKNGFKKIKIGDDAIIDLTSFFDPEGKIKKFQNEINRFEKKGFHVVWYDPPVPPSVVSELKQVSDEWLQLPGRRERTFTLGMFEPEYVQSIPVLAVLDSEEQITAFVNILPTYFPGLSTIDLMRHKIGVPSGTMDFLFISLFRKLLDRGFKSFSMGLVPMSGFRESETATREERSIHFFFQHLNFMFSFSGLKYYKGKFATSWEPRYLIFRNYLELPLLALALIKVTEIKGKKILFRKTL